MTTKTYGRKLKRIIDPIADTITAWQGQSDNQRFIKAYKVGQMGDNLPPPIVSGDGVSGSGDFFDTLFWRVA